jgi:hypothetical protein
MSISFVDLYEASFAREFAIAFIADGSLKISQFNAKICLP